MTNTEAPEAPEPGAYASEALDRKLIAWRNAPTAGPVDLRLHLLRTGIADYIDDFRHLGKGYAAAHASVVAIIAELPTPVDEEAQEAAAAELTATLAAVPTTAEPTRRTSRKTDPKTED